MVRKNRGIYGFLGTWWGLIVMAVARVIVARGKLRSSFVSYVWLLRFFDSDCVFLFVHKVLKSVGLAYFARSSINHPW